MATDKYFSIHDGNEETIDNNPVALGKLSITKDLGNMYYDVENGFAAKRIKLGVGKKLPNGAEIFNDYINNIATGNFSHAEGSGTIASGDNQHVSGRYNIEDIENLYTEIIGNGQDNNSRSNARTLDRDGNEWLAGKLTVGIQPENNMDVATKKYVDDNRGDVTFATFEVNSDGDLIMTTPDNFQGINFILTENGDLEVVINED